MWVWTDADVSHSVANVTDVSCSVADVIENLVDTSRTATMWFMCIYASRTVANVSHAHIESECGKCEMCIASRTTCMWVGLRQMSVMCIYICKQRHINVIILLLDILVSYSTVFYY